MVAPLDDILPAKSLFSLVIDFAWYTKASLTALTIVGRVTVLVDEPFPIFSIDVIAGLTDPEPVDVAVLANLGI